MLRCWVEELVVQLHSCTASQQRCFGNEWERDRRLSTTVSKDEIECAGWGREGHALLGGGRRLHGCAAK